MSRIRSVTQSSQCEALSHHSTLQALTEGQPVIQHDTLKPTHLRACIRSIHMQSRTRLVVSPPGVSSPQGQLPVITYPASFVSRLFCIGVAPSIRKLLWLPLATNCNQRNYHPPYIHVVAPARRVLVRARQCGGDYMRDLPWMGREACEQEGTQNLPVRDYIARFTVGLLCGLNSRHTIVDVSENHPSLSDPILLPFWLRGTS